MEGTARRKFGPVFALTGGIGSGKSRVATLFAELGVPVVDADVLARDAVARGSRALEEIQARFGSEVLLPTGELDRAALGRVVFADPAARSVLNAIVHPRVQEAAQAAFEQHLASGHRLVCYVIPLLFETRQQDRFRPVVLVHCSEKTRIERIRARDGITEDEARARIGAQIAQSEKMEQADVLIENEGTLEELEDAAAAALRRVFALCETKSS